MGHQQDLARFGFGCDAADYARIWVGSVPGEGQDATRHIIIAALKGAEVSIGGREF